MTRLRIAVVGAGRMGCGLARRWSEAGHDVTLCFSRDPERLRARAEAAGARHGSVEDAVAIAGVVLLAPPWPAVATALDQARSLARKFVVDCVNPRGVDERSFFRITSAAEEVAAREPLARVVKAFNLVPARALDERWPASTLIRCCGDDPRAVDVAGQLIRDAGFTARASGGLREARRLERQALHEIRRMRVGDCRPRGSRQVALSS